MCDSDLLSGVSTAVYGSGLLLDRFLLDSYERLSVFNEQLRDVLRRFVDLLSEDGLEVGEV